MLRGKVIGLVRRRRGDGTTLLNLEVSERPKGTVMTATWQAVRVRDHGRVHLGDVLTVQKDMVSWRSGGKHATAPVVEEVPP